MHISFAGQYRYSQPDAIEHPAWCHRIPMVWLRLSAAGFRGGLLAFLTKSKPGPPRLAELTDIQGSTMEAVQPLADRCELT